MVFLWHFWATINALSDDFIWMKASPEGRPWGKDTGGIIWILLGTKLGMWIKYSPVFFFDSLCLAE